MLSYYIIIIQYLSILSEFRVPNFGFFSYKPDGSQARILEVERPIQIIGMGIETNMKSIYREVPSLGKKFRAYKESHEIPAGKYVIFPVRPKNRFGWGLAIAETKRYVYNWEVIKLKILMVVAVGILVAPELQLHLQPKPEGNVI